jgi:hypothetical protein
MHPCLKNDRKIIVKSLVNTVPEANPIKLFK